jgi:hypothetical protein
MERIAAGVKYGKVNRVRMNDIKRRSHIRCRAKLRTTATVCNS